MSIDMPETPDEMLAQPGVTKSNFDKYGKRLLDITVKYSAEKFLLQAEHGNIEEFQTQTNKPGPSKPKGSDWIDVDNQGYGKSNYFAKQPASSGFRKKKVTRRKKRKSPKKTTKGRKSSPTKSVALSGSLALARKTFNKSATPFKSPKKYSHMAGGSGTISNFTSTAATKKNTTSSGSGLGLMPMPKPVERKIHF